MSKKILFLIIFASALLIAAAVLYNMFFGSAVKERKELYISRDMDYDGLLDSLQPIRHRRAFDLYAGRINLPDTFKPGHYVIEPGMGIVKIARMLKIGDQTPVDVTFNNIRTLPDLAGRLAEQLEADSLTLVSALLDDSVAVQYGFAPGDFIAMFIPDTYQLYWTVSPAVFIERMNKEYGRFWNGTRRAKLEKTGLSQKEASTMASIIDEETNMGDEMATIAGVYINRIKSGMPLQADPTVKFSLGDPTMKRILHKHLSTDSPYNTYLHKGLPPGPIRMPSARAIDAVLDYQHHNYLYFCAKPDFSGYHAFAKTYSEHLRNAAAYSKALDVAGIK